MAAPLVSLGRPQLARAPAARHAALSRPMCVSVRASSSIRPIIAFRDVQRAHQLMDTAQEFADLWVRGKLDGPLPEIIHGLDPLVDESFRAISMSPTELKEHKGLEGLKAKLQSDVSDVRFGKYRTVASACNDDDDVAYALMEVTFVDEQGEERKGFQIWKMDVMLDDSVKRITAVTERGMLDPRGIAGVAGRQAAAFPLDSLSGSQNLDREKAREAIQAWCLARTAGENEESVLGPHLASDFKLWDVSGSLPGLWAAERGQTSSNASTEANEKANADSCALNKMGTMDFIKKGKENYEMQTVLVDTAVSTDKNVGFSHWRSTVKPKSGKGGEGKVEGMEVVIYNPQGQIQGMWMFRDLMDFERSMLKTDDAKIV